MRSLVKQKKAQIEFSLVTFVVIIIGLILLSPFILKIFNSFVTPFGSAVGNITPEAETRVTHITTVFVGFWDFIIIFGFMVNVILLLLSAFLADTHPAWLVAFIIFAFLLFIFASELTVVLEKIYDSPQFALEVSQLAMVDFLREWFGTILLGLYFLSGVILFAKFAWGGNIR